jgi:hypothetical protein
LRFSTTGRALYYEWLNVILGFGGSDLELGEGNIATDAHDPSIGSDDTVNGTRFFLRLLAASEQPRSGKRLAEVAMDHLVEEFDAGTLPLYVGWTDSFRFNEQLQALPARVSPSREPRKKVRPWFARVPRDVRRNRRPLVAPWVATVPPNDGNRDQVGFMFLDVLLNPETQQILLRHGFPSSSDLLVTNEIERLRLESHSEDRGVHDYTTYLLSLHDALVTGHLVPNIPKTDEYIATIREALETLATMALPEDVDLDTIRQHLAPAHRILARATR